MTFYPGQPVRCINDNWRGLSPPQDAPKILHCYTVVRVVPPCLEFPEEYLVLYEVAPDPKGNLYCWHSTHFSPIGDRKTSIEGLKALLTPESLREVKAPEVVR